MPKRPDWGEATKQGRVLRRERGRKLVEALGFTIEQKGAVTHVLRVNENGSARAVAIFLEQTEQFDRSSARFPGAPPISVALSRAEAENLPYVLLTRGDSIRIYSTRKDIGVGRKGRSETFIEVNVTLLPDRLAGYLPLIFGAGALAANGSFEITRLREEDPELFETGGERKGAYSGEEYRQELRAALQDPTVAEQLRRLPWGSGTGRVRVGSEPGFVFCARVADHPRPRFAFVSYADPAAPTVVENELTCLAAAHSGADTERHLPAEVHALAYEAWALARSSLYRTWIESTDPRNLQPRIPRFMREAIELLTLNPPPNRTQEEVDAAIRSLQGAYGPRDQRAIRQAMRGHETPIQAGEAVIAAVRELRLEASHPPQPLPVITEEDVHIVCWMAIVPETRSDFRGSLSERQESLITPVQLDLAGG